MKERNYQRSISNPNENWMAERLKATALKWTRQACWGYRIFDFWNVEKGIAVEVDGPEHNRQWDQFRDDYNYNRSGIVVIRVRNRNEDDAEAAIARIASECTWNERRQKLGLKLITMARRAA